ncbi:MULTISPECIES: formimidoylglutamate deiminase [Bradyrhizobium]|jgi:formimidoylglutamate deiminase|uniref:formimidoylglutamate deiminase n=1 Tax=Bradyrhizobium TaxID=374 RepID=UPI0008415065|nr:MULTISPECIES: formimidoylglutamate deiminase [Bradyrhizobium]MBP2427716.1 formiminoglutamate deiminase [Bradyrhizobium elkanii]MCP1930514.1 formiminoglutamate deiminase [Bradyrhizobium elkanii]MCP1970914.1 formiminoglutamate deiminase [Bradyrhizobium elkanii]MCS3481227.1 formiminoglutamate deiminase [Bradyrhizobium elkanii]MCS3518071.1 formiminoglutamate deiminase [Bradyrhizobium elkanii]
MTRLHFAFALLPSGWANDVQVVVADGAIASVTAGVAPSAGDERHQLAVPGLASLHSHAFQRGMAGLAELRGDTTDTFWTWRETMYRFALTMTPDDVAAVATLLYVEMLERGFTRVGEFHYLHHDRDGAPYANLAEMAVRIAEAASASGIGLTLLPSFYAHSTFGGAAPHAGQRRFICSVDQFATLMTASREAIRDLPGANIGIAPHSLRAVAPDELAAIIPLAKADPIQIHAAEQVREVEDCLAWSGQRPVQWLLEHAPVDQRWCLIHATHMTEQEVTALARSGAVAGLCPVTEASLGDGIFSAREFLAAGGRFGIGTDSNVLVGVADELRQLEYGQRLKHRERNVLSGRPGASTGRALFDHALAGGAQALAQTKAGLAPGARADIVSLDTAHPSLAGRSGDAVLDGWLFATGSDAIDCVWAGGDRVVAGGRHRLRDKAREQFNASVRRLVA